MKRNTFITTLLAWTPVPPLVAATRPTFVIDNRKAVLVRAGEDRSGKPFKWLDATFTVKVSGNDNEGRLVIFDTLRPEKVGPPLHLHTDCDEWFLVMEGEFKFQVGEQIMRLKSGDSLTVPKGMPHSFVKQSEGIARLIVGHQPAGMMEAYFRTVIQQLTKPSKAGVHWPKATA